MAASRGATPTNNAGQPPSAAAAGGARCAPAGPTACFCDDGSASGTQVCDANGALTQCLCPTPAAASTGAVAQSGAAGGRSESAALCPDLLDKSGCMLESHESKELPASILFVVDKSGSMACNPPPLQDSASCEANAVPVDGTQLTKWQITVSALQAVFDSLLAKSSTAQIGLTFFSNDNTCGVHSTPNVPLGDVTASQVASLKTVLDTTVPSGGTPLVGATTLGYAYLHQEAGSAPGCVEPCGAPGNRYVVLLTDGTDSCPMPTRAEDAAECNAAGSCTSFLVGKAAPLAAQANIKTFVIGAPGSEPARGYLSELAFVGGTARTATCTHDPSGSAGDCHFDMTTTQDFAGALASALGSVSGAALGCEFAVPPTDVTITPGTVNVQYRPQSGDPTCFAYDSAPCSAGSNGWQFAKRSDGSDDLSRVVICGSACDQVRADPMARVDVLLGCETIILQ
ncbi:MAG: vWA domain-containing protein [Polyangiales bacterium]